MEDIKDVTITKVANIYYDGAVTSRTLTTQDGEKITLGIMMPGDYTFDTKEAEIMEILSGELEVKLPGEDWQKIDSPETFNVPPNSSFDLKIKTVSDYCCTYINDSISRSFI